MKKNSFRTALLMGATLLALPAFAQSSAAGSTRTYQEERAMCAHLPQDPAACAREAGAARQAARQGQLTSVPDYTANALARCAAHAPVERSACEARITGAGQSSVQGSVMGGGVIRESVTTVVMPAPAVARPLP
ncbi:MAG: hypothetical protein EOO29_11095 [Comamonadaceae bacterium]|nr:MAG: hypothetical protein EOO29_11095 [Comamonadaceae bacterium]